MSNESCDLAVDYVLEHVPDDNEEGEFDVPKIAETCDCIPIDVEAPDGFKWSLRETKHDRLGVMYAIYEASILN